MTMLSSWGKLLSRAGLTLVLGLSAPALVCGQTYSPVALPAGGTPAANMPAALRPAPTCAAQSMVAVRRLPPLVAIQSMPSPGGVPAASSQASVVRASGDPSRAATDGGSGIQLASAHQARGGENGAPRVRRLPPLSATTSPLEFARPASPAHGAAAAGISPPNHGSARVMVGSAALTGRAVYLGPPPQKAKTPGGLSSIGSSTLKPLGLLPRDLPNPLERLARWQEGF